MTEDQKRQAWERFYAAMGAAHRRNDGRAAFRDELAQTAADDADAMLVEMKKRFGKKRPVDSPVRRTVRERETGEIETKVELRQ